MPVNRQTCRIAILLVVCAIATAATAQAAESQKYHSSVKAAFRESVAKASDATVRIRGNGEDVALGTVIDADGLVVTKASQLEGKITCWFPKGKEVAAKVLGTDEDTDLALLKVEADKLTPAVWRTGDVPLPGSLVATASMHDDPLAWGVVSTPPRRIRGSTRRDDRRGRLGVGLGDGEEGLGITSVSSGTAAAKAGIKAGDRIVRIDGEKMETMQQAIETVGSHPPGETIKLVLLRGGKELELSATLGRQPSGRSPQDNWGGGPFSRRRGGFPTALPHDTVLRPIDCGGPLVDTDGKIVGINIARALRVTSYAIPAETVQEVVAELREDAAALDGDE